MAKQMYIQQYIYKIHSSRILKSKDRNLKITIKQARKNEEIISLADSEALRMIDKFNGVDRKSVIEKFKLKKFEIKMLKKKEKTKETVSKIKSNYLELDELQYKSDYVAIIMDNPNDIDILAKGFKINDVEYKRLVGTTNGVKKNTIIYTPVLNKNGVPMYQKLTECMDNSRDKTIKLVPAKFEAYKALTCSASLRVTNPKGVLVVDDLVVKCKENIIKINSCDDGEPILQETKEPEEIEIDESDGYGLILPSLASKWSKDIVEDYLPSGFCIRNAFCKGMVFTFDFIDFANKIAKKSIVKDVWGKCHNINDVELILTTSMLKLWDSYSSIDDYLQKCELNNYGFAITKVCPKKLENERNMNYQFLQSYQLTDEEVAELTKPTVDEIKDVINGDVAKTILFLKGSAADDFNFNNMDNVVKALMVNKDMAKDPYIINRVRNIIKKKINDAKIGVIKVHGNYAVISGDPYALCQHIFECKVENDDYGLLRAGEIYSKYWIDCKSDKIVCFRSPMSCHSNIRVMNVKNTDEITYWYRYMKTVNVLNCHDSFRQALNGADMDGDAIITTDNPILLKNTRQTKTIMCIQKKAKKIVITEDSLLQANKNGFGDDIGRITNRITSMYDVQAQFSKDSQEYKDLDYRIMCGQLYQQDSIDKIKGIISKPMPTTWYDFFELREKEEDTEDVKNLKKYNQKIVANKKPYFMCYIYPDNMNTYKQYVKKADNKCRSDFRKSLKTLQIQSNKHNILSIKEKDFLVNYYTYMPYSLNNCTMNRICWQIEKSFKDYFSAMRKKQKFDYSIMKQGGFSYSKEICEKLKDVYKEYVYELTIYSAKANQYRFDKDDMLVYKDNLLKTYKSKCDEICPQEFIQCDILLDLCYNSEKSKKFVWDMCGKTIVENLLLQNDKKVTYYILDKNGEIKYCGNNYSKKIKEIEI